MSGYRPLLSIRRPQRPRLLLIMSAILATALLPELGQAQDMTYPPEITPANEQDSAKEILSRYAQAWRGKEEMALREDTVLAFWVSGDTGGEYHIILRPEGPGQLLEGIPESYTFGFETDIDTLRRIDRGEWNAFTAMGQARGSDPIPLMPRAPDGFKWTPDNRGYFIPMFFHFWNREWPERVLFGEGTTRQVHGANATVFYYDKGLRSAWYQVKAGMHVNADPADQTNDYHTLVIMSRGAVMCRLGGVERVLQEGEAVFIPAGMRHEFWAGPNQYGEVIILMFGEKA